MIGKVGGAKVVRKGRKKGSAQTAYPKIHKCFIRHLKVLDGDDESGWFHKEGKQDVEG